MQHLLQKLFQGSTPFCAIQKQDSDEIRLFTGKAHQFNKLSEIPRKASALNKKTTYDTIAIIPFNQIRERGYRAHDEGEKILCIEIVEQASFELSSFIRALPDTRIDFATPFSYHQSENEYKQTIQKIIDDEIGMGEGANFVIPREGSGQLREFTQEKAFAIFRTILTNDYGTYWKFIFYDGNTTFIGSTPERHLLVKDGNVKMNPISGTFKKDRTLQNRKAFKNDLLHFLNDQKEINELFMVVNEELKMMAKMCDQGGSIIGPLVKEMSALIHTEHLLVGKSSKDIMELFRESMFAATVVGSPVENSCNIISKYSDRSRRYYGSALMLTGRDKNGQAFLDSPITIRTFEISSSGKLHFSVGATLVKDSSPEEELRETKAKGKAILSTISPDTADGHSTRMLPTLYNDDEIAETLAMRNQTLSTFWFFKQQAKKQFSTKHAPTISLIHNGDDFLHMLSHMFQSMGIRTKLFRFDAYIPEKDNADITLLGPGPGNPLDVTNEKIALNYTIASTLLAMKKKSLFICLGHQILCSVLGFEVIRKETPFQGSQVQIDLFGRNELVGFYNTFVPIQTTTLPAMETSLLSTTQELIAIRHKHFIGYQFHPESILTQNGYTILRESIAFLLGEKSVPVPS